MQAMAELAGGKAASDPVMGQVREPRARYSRWGSGIRSWKSPVVPGIADSAPTAAGLEDGNIFNASNIASKRPIWPEGIEVEVSNNVELSDNKMGACMERPRLKKRKLMTVEQVKSLEVSFGVDSKLELKRKQWWLAEKLGLQPRQVAVWFQNRRAKWKTKQLEEEFRTLKSQYHRMLVGMAELKSEVARLTTELDQGKRSREPAMKGASTVREHDNTLRGVTHAKVDDHIVVQADQMDSIDWGNVIKQHSVSPTCSDYSGGIVHGGSPSFRQGDASLVESRVGRPLLWKEESFLDGSPPSTSTNTLTDRSLSNLIAMDWLSDLTT